ncbi:MAG TPA: hypothetical protein VFJ51_12710 [Nitrososphaeraceae archaeon]|nr:hypothetical protein [Nitrososphaeraceae archaeon]
MSSSISIRERKVLEIYDDGKITPDIAKELRISLRHISIILRNNQLSRRFVISKDKDKSTSSRNVMKNVFVSL